MEIFDCLVIGGGPAGITAAIYLKRAGKKIAILEKFVPGGQLSQISNIENYPGFDKIGGYELAQKLYNHAQSFGIDFLFEEVLSVDFSKKIKVIRTKKNTYNAKSVIIATGCKTRELNISGEQKFKGKGVSYCATCDGNFFKGKPVAVIGSGDSAISDAIYLSAVCSKVYLLTKNGFATKKNNPNELKKHKNIVVLDNAVSAEIFGEDKVQGLLYMNGENKEKLAVNAVFVAIGKVADSKFLQGNVSMTREGYLKVDKNCKTSVDGVFACGDIVNHDLKQITVATGEGTIAATEVIKYLALNK